MKKGDKISYVINKLEELYPTVPVPLNHKDPFTLLVAVLLSAQCTDERVNQITPKLFSLADNPYDMVKLSIEEIKEIILYGSDDKIDFSKNFRSGSRIVRKHKFEGIIPSTERRFKETDSEYIRDELSKLMSQSSCGTCKGSRLNKESRNVFVSETPIHKITNLKITDALSFISNMKLDKTSEQIAEKIIKEISERLSFLSNVGLNYLTLDRSAETLSGGEAQRIRLASQIGSGLVGVTYVLDEPSIGLHQRDNEKLINTLKRLQGLGNTVIVVEHDEEAIRAADHIIDIGPGAGKHGGEICAEGSLKNILSNKKSLTAKYLSGERSIKIPKIRQKPSDRFINIIGANENNLKNIDLEIPIGLFSCITGVSGSGKSSLINLLKALPSSN